MEARAVRTLWSYLRPQRRLLLAGGLLGLVGNAVALLQPLVAKQVIDAVGGAGSPLDSAGLVRLILGLIGLVLVGGVLAATAAYLLERAAAEIVRGVRHGTIRHILRLTVGAAHRPGDLVSRVTADTTLLSRAAGQSVVDIGNAVLMAAGAVVLMGLLDHVLLGVTLLVFTSILVMAAVAMPRIAAAQERVQASIGDIGAGLERVLGAFRTVKASGAEARETVRLAAATDRARDHTVTTARWIAITRVAAGLATQTAFLAVLGVGGARVAAGELAISSLVAFLLYLFSLTQPIGVLVQGLGELQSGLAAVRRIRAVDRLAAEPDDDGSVPTTSSTSIGLAAGLDPQRCGPASVEFRDVRFAYDDGVRVLDGVSFAVPPGETVAIVGGSGGGKTTVFSLLERFHDADAGEVLVDGTAVSRWPLSRLRAQIGYVEQDAPVLEGTLRANILYSAPGASDDELAAVLDKTRLTDLVDRMPSGIDTPVGHRGTTLSGGQRQRVAIARALLRRPRLLLLDEATSQLDADNERALRETVREIARTTTVLIVAHRLSTVVDADRIIVLHDGRVHEHGTHADLIAGDTLYARLAAMQLSRTDRAGRPDPAPTRRPDPPGARRPAEPRSPERPSPRPAARR